MISRRELLGSGAAWLVVGAAKAEAQPRLALDQFELTRPELPVAGLAPEHEGLVVAQLTDVHVGHQTPDARVRQAIRAVNAARPDLVVLTGDYVTDRRDPVERIPELLAGLQAPAVATLGNHDHWVDAPRIARQLEGLGCAVLRNQHTVLRLRGRDFTVVGIDDGATRHDDVATALRGVAEESRLVLLHTPFTALKLPQDQPLTAVAGHTHGGHMYFAGITPFIARLTGEPFLRGAYQVGRHHLYVNRGLGFSAGGMPPRINSDPEVAIFTLRSLRSASEPLPPVSLG